ncbi:TTL domain-containing protein, partial [Termitomyces sp. J132]
NDDGPPHPEDSPYILGLYRYLTEEIGWNVKVVVPSAQKSWIGKAYHIKEIAQGSYFYPKEDGTGEISTISRPLEIGEIAEWILLNGGPSLIINQTPATCANVALHNLFPGEIDLIVSGPNLGRNTSTAFALSSGTIGAALSSSLSKVRSIALSYGTVLYPTPTKLFMPAHRLGSSIIVHLWNNWGRDEGGLRNGEVDLYNINIPLGESLLTEEGPKICTTTMWRNSYRRLFKRISVDTHMPNEAFPAGPDALGPGTQDPRTATSYDMGGLAFKFSPDMTDLITPSFSSLPVGTDAWALHQGWISVTPLRASFGEPDNNNQKDLESRIWKLKL